MSIHIQNSPSQDDRLVPGIQIFKKNLKRNVTRRTLKNLLTHVVYQTVTTHARTHAHHCTQTVTQHVCSLNTTQTGATELFVGRLCARVEFGRIEKMLSNKLNASYIIHTPVHILQVAPITHIDATRHRRIPQFVIHTCSVSSSRK